MLCSRRPHPGELSLGLGVGLPDEYAMGKTRSERGQALIETAISILLFLGVTLALVTFGHAFMVVNMITHAARDGARLAATWPYRGACNAITNYDSIMSTVKAEIGTVTIAAVMGIHFGQ